MHIVEQKYKLYKNETESKMENPTHSFLRLSSSESQIKNKTVMSWSSWKKKREFFVPFIWFDGNYFTCDLSQCIVY